ncbi:MAG: type II toxin-antitoxin system PemK/MazF family toxin [bacterium]
MYLYKFKRPDKTRPVVILSRKDVISLLLTVTVAPIISTIYGIPSDVIVGVDQGLKKTSAINLDHVQTVVKNRLTNFIAHLDDTTMEKVCIALKNAVSC